MRGRFVSEGRLAGQGFARNLMEGLNSTRGGKFFANLLTAMRKRLIDGAKAAGQFAAKIGGIASAVIAVLPLLPGVGLALAKIGKVGAGAAPALVAMAVAVGVVGFALKKLVPAIKWGLEPLSKAFAKANLHASRLATGGVRPLASAFAKANMPALSGMMDQIGLSVQGVLTGFLRWGKTAEGVKAFKGIFGPIGRSVKEIGPHVLRAAIAFTSMLGRIMGVSTAVGTTGLTGLLDRLSEKFDKITKSSVSGSFAKIASAAKAVGSVISTVVTWVKRAADAYSVYQTRFGLVADALGVAAIAFGGPVGMITGAVGLIIRHWDLLKRGYQAVVNYFTKSPKGVGFIDDLKSAAATVWPAIQEAFTQIKNTVMPVIQEIGGKIANEFIPAIGGLVKALAPVAAYLIRTFGPVVAAAFKATLKIVSGFITWISGVIKVATGVINGDWSQIWAGLEQIASGAVQVMMGIVEHLLIQVAMIPYRLEKAAWDGGVGFIRGLIGGAKSGEGVLAGVYGAIAGNAAVAAVNAINAVLRQRVSAEAAAQAAIAAAQGAKQTPVPSYGGSGYTPPSTGSGSGKPKGVSPAEQKKRMKKLGQDLVKSLADGMGYSADKIKAESQKIAERIKKAFEGFAKKTKVDDHLLARLKETTKRLTALAKKREAILKRIAEMKDFRADVTNGARDFAGLTSLDFGDKAPTGETIRTGLQGKLAQLKAFAANIKTLIKRHVPRGLLRQIMEAGPEAGGPLAAALAGSTDGTLSGISQAQREIDKISKDLGNIGVDAAFGKGALAGLMKQKAAIESLMDQIARSFARSIAKALGVKLPKQAITSTAPGSSGKYSAPGHQRVQIELSLTGGSRAQLRETRKGLRITGGNAVIVGGV